MAKTRTADPNATYTVHHDVVNVYDPDYDLAEARNRGLVRKLRKGDTVSGADLKHADIVRLTEGPIPALKEQKSDSEAQPEPEGEDLLGGLSDFDPSAHTVDEVNAHLDSASDDEKLRVLAVETDGQGRRGILAGPHAV